MLRMDCMATTVQRTSQVGNLGLELPSKPRGGTGG